MVKRLWKQKNDICFEYEKLFGLQNSIGNDVIQDLMNNFSHAAGAFVEDDDNGRKTTYQLGQQSVINYIMAQLNTAREKAEKANNE